MGLPPARRARQELACRLGRVLPPPPVAPRSASVRRPQLQLVILFGPCCVPGQCCTISGFFATFFAFVWVRLHSKTSSFLAPKNANSFPVNKFLSSFPLFSIFFPFSADFPPNRVNFEVISRAGLEALSFTNNGRLAPLGALVKSKTIHVQNNPCRAGACPHGFFSQFLSDAGPPQTFMDVVIPTLSETKGRNLALETKDLRDSLSSADKNGGLLGMTGRLFRPGGPTESSPRRKPWDRGPNPGSLSPGGAAEAPARSLSPLPGMGMLTPNSVPRLTPWATCFRPSADGLTS